MLKAFPEKVDFWAKFASNLGLLKWGFFGISLTITLISLVMWRVMALKKTIIKSQKKHSNHQFYISKSIFSNILHYFLYMKKQDFLHESN
jgi:hypothetical protein